MENQNKFKAAIDKIIRSKKRDDNIFYFSSEEYNEKIQKELCKESNKLIDLSQKPEIENTSNSVTVELKRDWYEDIYNMDKPDRNNIIIDSRGLIKQSNKRYRRSTELERQQNKSNEHCYLETHRLIRFLSVDYNMPVLNSNSEIKSIIVVILHSTVVAIGITICIIVFRKYGYFDVKEHTRNIYDKLIQKYSKNNVVLETNTAEAAMIKTFLIDDRPPSYGACIV